MRVGLLQMKDVLYLVNMMKRVGKEGKGALMARCLLEGFSCAKA